jgi:hypothetical protein
MFGWTEMTKNVVAPPAQPEPVPVPPSMPIETPTVALASDPHLMSKVDRAIDAIFGGKKRKMPTPHSCGACGGIVWA